MAVLARGTWLLAVMLAALGCRSGPEQWGPFRGQVVDAETGAPIAGAHVIVLWVREPPSLHSTLRFYDALEALTDAAGRFDIPRRFRALTMFVGPPALSVFAEGYQMVAHEVMPADGRAYIDATTVRMQRLHTREEQCRERWLGPLVDVGDAIPGTMAAIREYNRSLRCWEIER